MEWLLAHADDTSLDEPFTEEEALQMKSNLEAPIEAAKKPLTEEEKAEKLAKLEELRNGIPKLNMSYFCHFLIKLLMVKLNDTRIKTINSWDYEAKLCICRRIKLRVSIEKSRKLSGRREKRRRPRKRR